MGVEGSSAGTTHGSAPMWSSCLQHHQQRAGAGEGISSPPSKASSCTQITLCPAGQRPVQLTACSPHTAQPSAAQHSPVRDDHRLDLVAPLRQERGVGQDLLHAQVGEAADGWMGGVTEGCGVGQAAGGTGGMHLGSRQSCRTAAAQPATVQQLSTEMVQQGARTTAQQHNNNNKVQHGALPAAAHSGNMRPASTRM